MHIVSELPVVSSLNDSVHKNVMYAASTIASFSHVGEVEDVCGAKAGGDWH
jgi:hypothetical protein